MLIKKIKSYICTFWKTHKILSGVFILSAIALTINIILQTFPAPFKLFFILGQVILNTCLGLIISVIFYFIVVFLKNEEDKSNIYPYISKIVWIILFHFKKMFENIHQCSNKDQKNSTITVEEIEEYDHYLKLSKQNENNKNDLYNTILNTKENISNNTTKLLIMGISESHLKRILLLFDTDIVRFLNNFTKEGYKRHNKGNYDLLNTGFYNLYQNLLELEEYYNENLTKYNFEEYKMDFFKNIKSTKINISIDNFECLLNNNTKVDKRGEILNELLKKIVEMNKTNIKEISFYKYKKDNNDNNGIIFLCWKKNGIDFMKIIYNSAGSACILSFFLCEKGYSFYTDTNYYELQKNIEKLDNIDFRTRMYYRNNKLIVYFDLNISYNFDDNNKKSLLDPIINYLENISKCI